MPELKNVNEKPTRELHLKKEKKKSFKYLYYLPFILLITFLLFFSLKNLKAKGEKPFQIVEILDAPQELNFF